MKTRSHECAFCRDSDAIILDSLSLEQVPPVAVLDEPSPDMQQAIGMDRMAETNVQISCECFDAHREKAMGHRTVQQRGDDSAVQDTRITFEPIGGGQVSRHAAVVANDVTQIQSVSVGLPAHDAVRMGPAAYAL